jgi:hypothetical protein
MCQPESASLMLEHEDAPRSNSLAALLAVLPAHVLHVRCVGCSLAPCQRAGLRDG